ncbi:hypothetical protein COX73_01700, partial [bacterium (Candidatus Gribaldobacteria) CG_4_10_14_0_2_um_filter_36_18]
TREPRAFYFKYKISAIRTWFNRWQRALEEAELRKKLILPDEDKAKEYGRIGAICIANYWNANLKTLRPLQVEQHYRSRLDNGAFLVGVFDQVRQVSLDWIKHHRPEIVKQGKLLDEYENVVIVDLKTGYLSYDYRQFKEDLSLMKRIRLQYELHENLQATLYTFLYERTTGKKPVGFIWYHLRSNKTFFTYRENRDYSILSNNIEYYLENVRAQLFPKHIGYNCKFCDFIEPCREDRYFLIVEPEELLEGLEEVEIVPNLVKKDSCRQLKLKFKIPRKKAKKPVVYLKEEEPIILRNLPWDE